MAAINKPTVRKSLTEATRYRNYWRLARIGVRVQVVSWG